MGEDLTNACGGAILYRSPSAHARALACRPAPSRRRRLTTVPQLQRRSFGRSLRSQRTGRRDTRCPLSRPPARQNPDADHDQARQQQRR